MNPGPKRLVKEVKMSWLGNLFKSGVKTKETVKMAKDPVCGMDCDEKTAAAKSEYMGKTYYFCAPGCKTAFDKNPGKYIGGGGQEMAGHGGHTM